MFVQLLKNVSGSWLVNDHFLFFNFIFFIIIYDLFNVFCFRSSHRRMPRSADMYKPSAYITYDIDAVHTALFNK